MDYQAVIPGKLRGLRAEKDMTQEQVADAIGRDRTALVRWENGDSVLPFDKACELADLFEVPLDMLAGRVDRRGE